MSLARFYPRKPSRFIKPIYTFAFAALRKSFDTVYFTQAGMFPKFKPNK